MGEFNPITTQEQLDAIISDRLKRQAESIKKDFEGFLSPEDFQEKTGELNARVSELSRSLEDAKTKAGEHDKTVAELNAKIHKYETDSVKTRIVSELGLPFELAQRLNGETEEEIRKDAEIIKGIFGSQRSKMPGFNPEGDGGKETEAAMKTMLQNMNL